MKRFPSGTNLVELFGSPQRVCGYASTKENSRPADFDGFVGF